jgi:hypothetical protein
LKVFEMEHNNKQGFDLDRLVAELEPVRPLRLSRGISTVAALMGAAIVFILLIKGMRADLRAADPDPMFLLRGGLLLLLGCASGYAVLSMASPAVGKPGQSWKMAVAAAALLPMTALVVAMLGRGDVAMANCLYGLDCMAFSTLGALATAIPMVLWLRRGAPTSPARAGWLTGVASGGLGAFAYGLHCPFNDVVYIGLWYTLAVGFCAVVGRLVVPRLIRW